MKKGFALQLKPVGSFCNLVCRYCYALPFRTGSFRLMHDRVWERSISECITTNVEPTITWHGGEPMLAGLRFYKRVQNFIDANRKSDKKIRQMIQTNGVLVTSSFAKFFQKSGFEIGISIDGPEKIHGMHRVDYLGRNSFNSAMRGLNLLRDAGLNPSVIATVTVETLPFATEVFEFLVEIGLRSIKYSPVYDSREDRFNISSDSWFKYLSAVFDSWMKHGDSGISILDLDEVIAWLDPNGSYPMCSSNQSCIRWASIDPDGTMYPCAYFRSAMPYGNILNRSLRNVVFTRGYRQFKKIFVEPPQQCQQCDFFNLCGNGCPATRVIDNRLDPSGVYVYCEERRKLFQKIKSVFISEQQHTSCSKGGDSQC